MAEGGFEMDDFGGQEKAADDDDMTGETPFIDIPTDESTAIHKQEDALGSYTGDTLANARLELLKSKVDAFLKVVADRDGLLPSPHTYSEFVLGEDGRTLYLKDGLKRVTRKDNSAQYLALKNIGLADFIRTHLFPEYTTAVTSAQRAALAAVKKQISVPAENIELADLPQRATDVDTAVKGVVRSETGGLPMRELLGLDEALRRQRGVLVDNLAKLRQLVGDIAQAEQELGGEEATVDHEKKCRVEDLLKRLRDERASRLEATAANRGALLSQFSRIRETITRILEKDTTLAERICTLFREQGVTISLLLTALGFIVSTIVLAIQNTLGGGLTPIPVPVPSGAAEWVKKQLKILAGWLKKLAEKAAGELPGIIGAVVSWLLKTAGSVAEWLAKHLWALVVGLVVVAAKLQGTAITRAQRASR